MDKKREKDLLAEASRYAGVIMEHDKHLSIHEKRIKLRTMLASSYSSVRASAAEIKWLVDLIMPRE